MTDRKAMKMALEALENTARSAVEQYVIEQHAVEVLRQALAQPEQEPVAWMFVDDEDNNHKTFHGSPPRPEQVAYLAKWNRPAWQPLYTAPPKRQWVGLTEEEVDAIRKEIFEKYKKALFVTRDVTSENDYSAFNFYRAIEEKLRIKND